MEQFRIRHDGFKEKSRGILINILIIFLLVGGGLLLICYYTLNITKNDLPFLLFIISFLLCLYGIGIHLGIKRQRHIFESYVLNFDQSLITRTQNNTPKISIPFSEVVEINRNQNGSIQIKGTTPGCIILIPAQVENYDQLIALLSGIQNIDKRSTASLLQKLQVLLSVLTIVCMAAVYISENVLIVGACGTGLLLFMCYAFYEINKNKNIDNKTKE